MPRAKYKRTGVTTKVREILAAMPPAERGDMEKVDAALKKGKVRASKQVIYGVRNELKNGGSGLHEETYSLRQLIAVQQTAKQVGGMESLKKIIKAIEKVSE